MIIYFFIDTFIVIVSIVCIKMHQNTYDLSSLTRIIDVNEQFACKAVENSENMAKTLVKG